MVMETKIALPTWLVTFWQGGTITVQASDEHMAQVMAVRAMPWAEVRRVEAWD